MIGLNLGVVYKQLPEKHGVLVAWRDGSSQPDNGIGFCRVGARRAHPTLGSNTDLPAVGELGLVATVDEEVNVWVCSLHWQDKNAVVPGITMSHHDSGATLQMNQAGEFQIDLPSGIQITSTMDGEPLPFPEGSSKPAMGGSEVNWLALNHPSGLQIQISPAGDIAITQANNVAVEAVGTMELTACGKTTIKTVPPPQDPDLPQDDPILDIECTSEGKIALTATGDVTLAGENVILQGGGARFAMADLVDWAAGHTHTSAASGSPTSAPVTAPPASAKSASTLTGKPA